jgi:hypothetical protein
MNIPQPLLLSNDNYIQRIKVLLFNPHNPIYCKYYANHERIQNKQSIAVKPGTHPYFLTDNNSMYYTDAILLLHKCYLGLFTLRNKITHFTHSKITLTLGQLPVYSPTSLKEPGKIALTSF